MYRIPGIINAFLKSSGANASRKIGEFLFVDSDGNATFSQTAVAFPLTEAFETNHPYLAAQVTGIAKVIVKTAAGIDAGEPVEVASDGTGVTALASGTQFGIALKKPAEDGDEIPVLIQIQLPSGGY